MRKYIVVDYYILKTENTKLYKPRKQVRLIKGRYPAVSNLSTYKRMQRMHDFYNSNRRLEDETLTKTF